jgi:hypothetical protein
MNGPGSVYLEMFEDWHRAMYNSTRNMSIFLLSSQDEMEPVQD